MDDAKRVDISTKVLTAKILTITSASISEPLNAFSSWMLAGLGAAYSLIFANIAALKAFVSLASIQHGLIWLLIALPLGLIQRILSAQILASAAISEKLDTALRSILINKSRFILMFLGPKWTRRFFFQLPWLFIGQCVRQRRVILL